MRGKEGESVVGGTDSPPPIPIPLRRINARQVTVPGVSSVSDDVDGPDWTGGRGEAPAHPPPAGSPFASREDRHLSPRHGPRERPPAPAGPSPTTCTP